MCPGWSVVLGRPKTVDAFVTHMKPIHYPYSVGHTSLVNFSGSACVPQMPMWGYLEMVPGAPEDHPCACKGHDSDFQHERSIRLVDLSVLPHPMLACIRGCTAGQLHSPLQGSLLNKVLGATLDALH